MRWGQWFAAAARLAAGRSPLHWPCHDAGATQSRRGQMSEIFTASQLVLCFPRENPCGHPGAGKSARPRPASRCCSRLFSPCRVSSFDPCLQCSTIAVQPTRQAAAQYTAHSTQHAARSTQHAPIIAIGACTCLHHHHSCLHSPAAYPPPPAAFQRAPLPHSHVRGLLRGAACLRPSLQRSTALFAREDTPSPPSPTAARSQQSHVTIAHK